ncbi:hypothetical protein F66182_7053 [Fusarium sp. NRRL 66182]|nr:hypothetical protein F66182_7053 [Fusarium sp. NRRL 66182]
MPSPVQTVEAVLCHQKPDAVESFGPAITARDALCHDPSHAAIVKEPPKDDRLSLSFLLQSTDPKNTSMYITVAEEPERVSEAPAWKHGEPQTTNWVPGTVDPRCLLLDLSDMLLDEPQEFSDMNHNPLQFSGIFNTPATSVDALTARVASLADTLRSLATSKPRLKEGLDQSCQAGFFSTAHFQTSLIIFFRRRHYPKGAIHWPTFNPDRVALHLLLGAVLTGTSFLQQLDPSYCPLLTASLLELCETYVFDELEQLGDRGITPAMSSHMLEVYQSATLLVALQGSANDIAARQRVSIKWMPLLVTSLRRSGMVGLKHQSRPDEITWDRFIYQETCIRVTTCAFVSDTYLTMFFNNPPLMAVKEMTGHLPCPFELWDADSSTAFQEKVQQNLKRSYPSSYTEAVSGLLAEEWVASTRASFGRLGTWDLLLLMSALYPVAFNCRIWSTLWKAAIERASPDERKWLGIARYAPEMAILLRKIVELSGTGEGRELAYLQCVASYDTADFHEFVRIHVHGGATTEG